MTGLALILVLIVAASIASNGADEDEDLDYGPGLPNVTLAEVLTGTLYPERTSYSWVPAIDGAFALTGKDGLVLNHVETGNQTVLVPSEPRDRNGNVIRYRQFSISASLDYVLLEDDYEKGWRHSFFANYWVWDVKNGNAQPLTSTKSTNPIPGEIGSGKVALTKWSPVGNHVAWVRDNDIYVTLEAKREVRITNDGSKNVINGISDWVYEEEVLESHTAMWFSPQATRLAFLKFNETTVAEYFLQYYERKPQSPYPEQVSVKYPKAGTPNPVVTLHIVTPSATNAAGKDIAVRFPPEHYFLDDDRIFVELDWIDEDSLLVRATNRIQNTERLYVVRRTAAEDAGDQWNATQVRMSEPKDDGWITRLQPLHLVPPSTAVGRQNPSYIEIKENEKGYAHLAYFSSVDADSPTNWLTQGKWEVARVLGIDSDQGIVYYLSAERGPSQRHVFSIHLDGSKKRDLTPDAASIPYKSVMPVLDIPLNFTEPAGNATEGVAHGFYAAFFSPGCGYYHLQYEGPDVPWSRLVKSDGSWMKEDNANAKLRELIPKYAVPPRKFFQLPIGSQPSGEDGRERRDGIEGSLLPIPRDAMRLNIIMQTPPYFDHKDTKRAYPVLLRVYGGPNSQVATEGYGIDFMTAASSAGGFITVLVDGRGTGYMGRAYRSSVAGHLGSVEVEDQIAAARWLAQLPYVDKNRIAIWGWSFGGYMSSKVVEADSGLFSAAMAVAPVTDWRFYDSIYTERYMRTPEQNGAGYDKSAVVEMEGFNKVKYLLVHGTADDNVHFQNSADLIWKLTAAQVHTYQVQVFTDSDHSISAGGAWQEVFVRLWRFIMEAHWGPGWESLPGAKLPTIPKALWQRGLPQAFARTTRMGAGPF
ncbi:dipeptidyl peptidase IV N-terminal region-domain-containing protein [Phlyctochytrium arcticum]|nr:dipeptidyl peptidase IV N-terminal region-domain-containing protein [Phlyctochytrium arcticum]